MSFFRKIVKLFVGAGLFFLKRVWVLLAVLLFVQIGLVYVSVSEVKVPDSLLEKILAPLEEEGFSCSLGDVRLRNLTVVTAQNIRVDTASGKEPLLRVRRCAVKLAPSGLISGNWIPQFVYADGAELFCPSANSVTGRSERLFSDGSLISHRRNGEIKLDAAKFQAGAAKFAAYGTFPGMRKFFFGENGKPSLNFGESPSPGEKNLSESKKIVVSVSRAAGTLSKVLNSPAAKSVLDSSTFVVRLEPDGNAAAAEITALCRSLEISKKAALKKTAAVQRVSVSPAFREILPQGPLRFYAESAEFAFGETFSERIQGGAADLCAAVQLPAAAFSGNAELAERLPLQVFVRAKHAGAASFRRGAADLGGILLKFSPRSEWAFPGDYDFSLNAVFADSPFALSGTFKAGEASLNFGYEAFPRKKDVLAFPQLRFIANQKDVKQLRFAETPNLRGSVSFAPGMTFEKADLDFSAGATSCGNIFLRSLNLAGTVTPSAVFLPEIRALGTDFLANADVFTEFSSSGDFRVRAWGTIDPSYIDGRLGWFWERIWRDLRPAPSEKRPRADIDVHGNWAERWEHVYGAIAGENCWGNGVLVDKVRLRVYEDPLLIAAFDMGFERGNDLVEGNLQWHYAMEPTYHYRDFRFLFNGTIPPKDVLRIVGEGLPEALSELETSGAGTAVVSGMFSGDPLYYPDRMLVNVKGSVPGAFSVFGIRGEDFSGEIIYDNGVVFVGNPFSARAEKGTVSGTIRVELPHDGHGADGSEVSLDLDLKNVRRSRLSETFSAVAEHIGTAEKGADAEKDAGKAEKSEDGNPKTAEAPAEDLSEIDAVFAGTLVIPDFQSLDASGKFSLREKDLFRLQVFGGFSRMLSSMKIDLTTFDLNRAEGSYTVRGGSVFLPDLRVFGESGEISVRAGVTLPDLRIKGEAVFRNLRGTRIPLIGNIVRWGSASTELLPVEISGSLDDIEWKVAPNISRIWSSPKDGYGIAPEKTEAAPEENAEESDEEN